MSIELLPSVIRENYEVHEWKHACAILGEDFPGEWEDIVSVLSKFRLLKSWITNPGGSLRAISIGVIITRCDELQDIFNQLDIGASYGASTTYMSKLLPRINGGSGGGRPLLVLGISRRLYIEDE